MGLQFEMKDEPDRTLPENKIFRAQLKDMKLREFTWTDYKDRDQPGRPVQKTGSTVQWIWEIQGSDEYAGQTVRGECRPDLSNHPRNRFRPWAEALLNREIPLGMKVDTDDLVGLSADITVRHRPAKDDPAKKFVEIDEVMPAGGGSTWDDQPPF